MLTFRAIHIVHSLCGRLIWGQGIISPARTLWQAVCWWCASWGRHGLLDRRWWWWWVWMWPLLLSRCLCDKFVHCGQVMMNDDTQHWHPSFIPKGQRSHGQRCENFEGASSAPNFTQKVHRFVFVGNMKICHLNTFFLFNTKTFHHVIYLYHKEVIIKFLTKKTYKE